MFPHILLFWVMLLELHAGGAELAWLSRMR